MENTVLVALSKHMVLRRQMDVIANNIANMNTTGFKRERSLFATYLQDVGDGSKIAFVRNTGVVSDFSTGPLEVTNNTFDIAIRGNGFFELETPQGPRFTRGGRFELDADGALVTAQGYPVLADDGFPILTVPEDTSIIISSDGTVTSEGGEIGRLLVVAFEDTRDLIKLGGGLYATEATAQPALDAEVIQGSIEGSNVEPIVEMTRMITLLRSFQNAQKLSDDENELRRRAINALAATPQSV